MKFFFAYLLFFSFCFAGYTQIPEPEVIANRAAGYFSVQALDVNGDGLLDAVSGYSDLTTDIFLNEGDFRFSSRFRVDYGDLAGDVGFIDFDGDGDLDILNADCEPCNDLTLFENTNGQTFEINSTIFSGGFGSFSFTTYAVHDFNNDGWEDFVFSGREFGNTGVFYFVNDGNGAFDAPIPMIHDEDITFFYLDAQDLNADGYPDVVGISANSLHIYLNQNGTSFADPQVTNIGSVPDFYIKKTDVNGDGVGDYYFRRSNCVVLLPSDNNGGFSTAYEFFCGNVSETGYFLDDADGDGDPDIFHGKAGGIAGVYLKTNDGGSFSPSIQLTFPGEEILGFSKADFNNDGLDDLLVLGDDEYLGWIQQVQPGIYSLSRTIASPFNPRNLAVYDIDGDEDPDISLHYDDWAGFQENTGSAFAGITTLYNSDVLIRDVAYADMDNDADNDLVILLAPPVTPLADSSVIWIENDDLSFENVHLILTDFHNGDDLQIHDFDQDGDADIALFSVFGAAVYLENNGDATFVNGQTLGGAAHKSKILDINQDSFDDLLAWNFDGLVFYYENNTTGGFLPRVAIGESDRPVDCAAFDFDEDNDLDIVVSYHRINDNRLVVFENNNGAFDQEFIIAQPFFPDAVEVIDLHQDGQYGILSGNELQFFKHLGDFEFELDLPSQEVYLAQLLLLDYNQNGNLDLIGHETGSGNLYLFSDVTYLPDYDDDGYSTSEDCDDQDPDINPGVAEIPNNDVDENCDGLVLIIDEDEDGFNSDEDCDDMNEDINPGAPEIPGNNIDENCDGSDELPDVDEDGYAEDVDCDDLNADINPGAVDIPDNDIDEDCDGNDTPSIFNDQQEHLVFSGTGGAFDVNTADMDGDGDTDILGATDHALYWLENDGDGNFPDPHLIFEKEDARFLSIFPVDIDQDGDIDILSASENDAVIALYINQGNQAFGPQQVVYTDAHHAYDVYAADLDNNGTVDIISSTGPTFGGFNDKVAWFSNEGNGQFSSINLVSTEHRLSRQVMAFDIDNDLDQDLFVTVAGDNRVVWYENVGSGNFSDQKLVSEDCLGAGGIDITDLDQDGTWEVVVANRNAGTPNFTPWALTSFSYQGNDQFSWPMNIGFLGRSPSVVAADLNNDCIPDILTCNFNNPQLGVFLNVVSFPFHRISIGDFTAGNGNDIADLPNDVHAADLDNDGDQEIIYAATGNATIAYFENMSPVRDNDNDNFTSEVDCDDCNAAINPDAPEIPDNGIDEDCSGSDLSTSVRDRGGLSIRIAPNPFGQLLRIAPDQPVALEVRVYNLQGAPMLAPYFIRGPVTLDLNDLPSGMYILEIRGDDSRRQVEKIVKLK